MKYITGLLAGFVSLILASCSDDFLSRIPISNASVDNFYHTEQDFELGVNGAYVSLRSSGVFHDYVPLIGDLHSDNTMVGTTAGDRVAFQEMSEFNDQSSSVIVTNVWNHHYVGIARCNTILSRIEPIAFENESRKDRLIAETRFLRALFYFNLVRIFGEVPLVLSEVKSIDLAYGMARTPVREIYDAIEADLIFASQKLPSSYSGSDVGRAASWAARGILGKVYLTQKKYVEAIPPLKEIISSGQYLLLPDFNALWKTTNKNNKESLFEVQFKKQAGFNTGSNYSSRFTPYLSSAALLGLRTTSGGYNTPTEDLMNAYKDPDLRKEISVAEGYTDENGNYVTGLSGRHTRKFLGAYTDSQGAEDNWPVLRYADVLLMCAEALNEVSFQPDGEAFIYLNQVRARAGLPPATTGSSSPEGVLIANQQQFREIIADERRLELAFEGHRWFDLVRTGKALEVLRGKNYDIQEYQLLLPIPQEQIDVNPRVIKQNSGY